MCTVRGDVISLDLFTVDVTRQVRYFHFLRSCVNTSEFKVSFDQLLSGKTSFIRCLYISAYMTEL